MAGESDLSGSELLQKAGIAAETANAVIAIDGLLQRWRRRAMKREMGTRALVDLNIPLDLNQLDVLGAIAGPSDGSHEETETMIATVAERLNIDPSRASRLVSEMVYQGYARRAVSQADARRTIIELTERGRATLSAVRTYKFIVMGEYLSGWKPEEIAAFVPLLQRFGSWMDGIESASEKHAAEITTLARDLEKAQNG